MEWRPAGWSVGPSVNLPLHHKVQKFSSRTGSSGWSQKKGHKMVVVVVRYYYHYCCYYCYYYYNSVRITHSNGGHSGTGSNLFLMPFLTFSTICSLAEPQYGSAASVTISHSTTPYDLRHIKPTYLSRVTKQHLDKDVSQFMLVYNRIFNIITVKIIGLRSWSMNTSEYQ